MSRYRAIIISQYVSFNQSNILTQQQIKKTDMIPQGRHCVTYYHMVCSQISRNIYSLIKTDFRHVHMGDAKVDYM
jgi:hypothetical protein